MALTTEQREAAWQKFVAYLEAVGPVTDSLCRKSVLRTALDEAVGWTEKANVRTSFNNDLSDPFKTDATVQQKMVLLAFALLYESGALS